MISFKFQTISKRRFDNGAVSLFVVLFTAVLLTIATVSFIRIMVADQRQATLADVSQSAYDSSMAGVEDAKRLLLLRQEACRTNSPRCNELTTIIESQTCDTLSKAGISTATSNGETLIQQSSGSENDMHQAYTCVKINSQLSDYRASLGANESTVIPVRVPAGFSSFTLRWYNIEDVTNRTRLNMNYPSPTNQRLYPPTTWRTGTNNTPPLMRAAVIQAPDNGSLANFDSPEGMNAVYLYPATSGTTNVSMSSVDRRSKRIADTAPTRVRCETNLSATSEYACSVRITPNNLSADRTLYIQLTAYYQPAHFQVDFASGGGPVLAETPQYEVDSTGRANDMFRRTLTRLELTGRMTYPASAVSVRNALCKDFVVSASLYRASCTP